MIPAKEKSKRYSPWASIAALTLLCLSHPGCAKVDRRVELKGVVTLDGAPLEHATLILTPKGKGQAVAATITSGSFEVPPELGPTLGVYTVRINPVDGNDDPESYVANAKSKLKKQLIPQKYQSDGTLTLTVLGTPGESHRLELKSVER